MRIEKSANHSHFFTRDRVVYEMLTNGETRTIRQLDFYFPNWEILPENGVNYLNKHYEYYNKQENQPETQAIKQPEKQKPPLQMDLFS